MAYARLFVTICIFLTVVFAAENRIQIQIKCGLPTFFDRLPAEAKKTVKDIWANYTGTGGCKNELEKQRAVVNSLDSETKKELFNNATPINRGPPICGLPHFLSDLPVETQEKLKSIWTDYVDGIECEDMQNATQALISALPADIRKKLVENRQHALTLAKNVPEFMKNLDPKLRQKFQDIFFNKFLNKTAKTEVLKELAKSVLTGDQLRLFYKYIAKREVLRRFRIDAAKTKEVPSTVAPIEVNEDKVKPNAATGSNPTRKNRRRGRKNGTLVNGVLYAPVAHPPKNQTNAARPRVPPCGIPPFMTKLSAEVQGKIKAIWANYKEGNDCKNERKATRDIIQALPADIRLALRFKTRQSR